MGPGDMLGPPAGAGRFMVPNEKAGVIFEMVDAIEYAAGPGLRSFFPMVASASAPSSPLALGQEHTPPTWPTAEAGNAFLQNKTKQI
jgi:hypothetical protein